ncbi:hypothetical protein U0070_020688 [Myodes glareolus]|uniref:Uncharacterized protein n=1 Tax=Myodes glareolus TaxID=447135 RepID=A0AAW0K477_MYOGA
MSCMFESSDKDILQQLPWNRKHWSGDDQRRVCIGKDELKQLGWDSGYRHKFHVTFQRISSYYFFQFHGQSYTNILSHEGTARECCEAKGSVPYPTRNKSPFLPSPLLGLDTAMHFPALFNSPENSHMIHCKPHQQYTFQESTTFTEQTSTQRLKLILVIFHCVRAECILDVHEEKGFKPDNGVKDAGGFSEEAALVRRLKPRVFAKAAGPRHLSPGVSRCLANKGGKEAACFLLIFMTTETLRQSSSLLYIAELETASEFIT